jgi:hypothetical protein
MELLVERGGCKGAESWIRVCSNADELSDATSLFATPHSNAPNKTGNKG